jgi:hypothetical protein
MKNTLLVSLLCIALTACGGGGGSSAPVSNPVTPVTPVTPPTTPPVTPPVVPVVPPVVPVTPTVANSIPLSVNTGINGNYLNGLFGSVTICQPSTASSGVAANCQTINNILFDTGSVGLRIAANALPAGFNLPTALDQSGNKIAECTHFADGVTWGTVNRADVKLGGEIATNIPVQIVGENVVPVPASCSGSGKTMDTAQAIGANGILGIGLFKQDCGNGCALSATYNIYYTCPATGCVSTKMPTASQVANPIAQFPQDSNGNIIALNAIPDTGTNNVSGTLFFGVGTQSNNTFNNLNVIQTDGRGMFGITYNNKN